MAKLSKDSIIEGCHDCSRIDIIKGYVCLENYKHILNPHGDIPKDCPLQDVEVIKISANNNFGCKYFGMFCDCDKVPCNECPIDKIIIVKKKGVQ
jgi:hypothetical protein